MDDVGQAALDRALDQDQDLVLFYQPIHDAHSGEILSAEALTRQRRSSGEMREASVIHEAAEKSPGPELVELESLLLRRATADAARWQQWSPVRLNVNLSPREFREGDVAARFASLSKASGIDPLNVNLEITETAYIAHPRQTVAVLDALRELGLSLWLDDFGSGHSSITHLLHFPLAGLKIGGGFIRPLPGNARARAIVGHVIALAHDLGLQVTAEEVENQEQLDLLRELSCDSIQGYLYNRPMSAPELETVLRSRPVTPPSDSVPLRGRNGRGASRGPSSRSS